MSADESPHNEFIRKTKGDSMKLISIAAALALTATAAVAQQRPVPQPTWKPKPCSPGQPCQPTCPTNDPSGCGIFVMRGGK